MHHFVLPTDLLAGDALLFPVAQSHQIARVLRLRAGDEVVVLDGAGRAEVVTLTTVDPRETRGVCSRAANLAPDPCVGVEIYLAMIRPERFEWALQKGTELGVSRFVPLHTIRCVRGERPARVERLESIAREATEQCHRLMVPRIDSPMSLTTVLEEARSPSCVLIMLHGGAANPPLRDALPSQTPGLVRLLIGPEGGWEDAEVEQARKAGATIARLGPRILRAETASIVAATLCLSHYGAL